MIKNMYKLVFISIVLSIAFSFVRTNEVKASTVFNITPTSDCTLENAIINANNDDQSGSLDCPAGTGADVINLGAGTYSLTADLPYISPDLTIAGAGADTTIIDGVDLYRTLNVDGSGSEFIVSDISIRGNGDDNAAGIYIGNKQINYVTIENVRVYENTIGYGGIHLNVFDSQVNILHSEIDHNSSLKNNNAAGLLLIPNSGNSYFNLDGLKIHHNDNQSASNALSALLIVNAASATLRNSSIYSNTSELATAEIISNKGGASVINTTISDNQGSEFAGLVLGSLEDDYTYSAINSTIANNTSTVGTLGNSAGLVFVNLGAGAPVFNAQNTILTNNTTNSVPSNCLTSGMGGTILPFNSLGGNISDDDTCSSVMIEPSDINSTDPLLGLLADNGGPVPTIPLLPGSIAIDSGTTVAGLTTDARGITRPQCAAFDSGAYEYNGTCPTTTTGEGNVLTYPDPITSSTVTLELPSDVTNGTVSAISPTTIPKDTFFSYPLGLTSFQFDTTIGATKTITLYYDLPGDPSSYTARKYNTNTKTFSTIQGASITRVTYNNKSMIKLTYDITDGGTLDQDNVANGTIVDPVGLAAATVGVPNTGIGGRP